MASSLLDLTVIFYLVVQVCLGVGVSIFGALYVLEQQRHLDTGKRSFFVSWIKIVWKMRSVYGSFSVHIFDVFTDLLIIIEWLQLEANGQDNVPHIDANIMAYDAIGVLVAHKIVTIIVFWSKERNIVRCILVLFDLLIIQEIYVAHTKIITNYQNNTINNVSSNDNSARETKEDAQENETRDNEIGSEIELAVVASGKTTMADNSKNSMKSGNSGNKKDEIDTTTSFKLVRSLEAVFESIPQSVLQLVFLLRTGFDYGSENSENKTTLIIISILSIFQSIISMTNAILKSDNTQMTLGKWKKYKKRFPPTIEFLKHAICRMSEVIYRIGLLSLLWTICEGEIFGIVFGIEILFVVAFSFVEGNVSQLRLEDLFLRFQTIVILPSELVYAIDGTDHESFNADTVIHYTKSNNVLYCIYCCFCCYCLSHNLTTHCANFRNKCIHRCCSNDKWQICRVTNNIHFVIPGLRIGVSIMEILLMIIYGLYGDNGTRKEYISDNNEVLIVFCITVCCLLIYSQYTWIFPDFSLPNGVSVRSKHGLAYNGELEELKRINIPSFPIKRKVAGLKRKTEELIINNKEEFWEEKTNIKGLRNGEGGSPLESSNNATVLMYALANGQYHVVNWLKKEQNCKSDELFWNNYQSDNKDNGKSRLNKLDENFAQYCIDPKGWYFDVQAKSSH